MAKKSIVERDRRRRRMVKQYRKRRLALQKKMHDKTLSVEERFEIAQKLALLPRDSSKTRCHNRCAVTGRGRSVYRYFGLSRIILRELAATGEIPGTVRSSW
ncbi:MAG: 30S ribosomal protein S14 [Alphaproteobacteria bacterium GM202ARS2]|nr:30S ribosomal protein S14 [Alphaproteobacteria bacterium GM202ARS2]